MALAGKELGSFLDEPHLAHFATIGPDGKRTERRRYATLSSYLATADSAGGSRRP
jgi:hypothetical protein